MCRPLNHLLHSHVHHSCSSADRRAPASWHTSQGGYLQRHKGHHKDDDPATAAMSLLWQGQAAFHSRPSAVLSSHTGYAAITNTTPLAANINGGGGHDNPLNYMRVRGVGNFTDAIHTDLDLLTLSNVPPGSPKMWVHLASVYVITLFALKVGACGPQGSNG